MSDRQSAAAPHAALAASRQPAARRRSAATSPDLNRLFLERALDPGLAPTRWFQLPAATVARLAEVTPRGTGARGLQSRSRCSSWRCRRRASLRPGASTPSPTSRRSMRSTAALVEARRSFGLVALGVARAAGRRRRRCRPASRSGWARPPRRACPRSTPSESFRLASWPGLIRPRWPAPRAVLGACWPTPPPVAVTDDLRWAYCAGLCLLGQCEREPVAGRARPVAARAADAPPRPAGRHRRSLLRRWAHITLRSPSPGRPSPSHEGPVAAPAVARPTATASRR